MNGKLLHESCVLVLHKQLFAEYHHTRETSAGLKIRVIFSDSDNLVEAAYVPPGWRGAVRCISSMGVRQQLGWSYAVSAISASVLESLHLKQKDHGRGMLLASVTLGTVRGGACGSGTPSHLLPTGAPMHRSRFAVTIHPLSGLLGRAIVGLAVTAPRGFQESVCGNWLMTVRHWDAGCEEMQMQMREILCM